jgi:para-nitrobenzyl esterase
LDKIIGAGHIGKEITLMEKVKINTGYITGTVIGESGQEVYIYRGIPYAAPPVGNLRWKPPQPASPWSGIRECTVFCQAAPQSFSSLPGTHSDTHPNPRLAIPQGEDCLYLNVLTQARKATDKLPVMVWMHGGGFIFGSANEPQYNLPRLPRYGVVLVNINMRLGPIGLLAHRLLSRESPEGVSGNYMFLDMIAGLKWVRKNIAAFGGDPNNVTIFGESGGAAKVISLMASPLAKGLFHRAIAESGSPNGKPLNELEVMGEKFFTRLGVDKEKDPLKAARALHWQKIMEVEQALVKELHVTGRGGLWDVAVDGCFMPEKPLDIFKTGKQHAVSYMLVANLGELSTKLGAYLIPAYLGLFSGAAKTGVRAHALIFDRVPAGWRQEGCISCHAIELGYVFGDWDNSSGFWQYIFSIAGPAGAKSLDPGLTDVDRKISEIMMRIWTQYAANGDPSINGLFTWPAWDKATDQYLLIAEKPEVKSGYSKLASTA